MLILRYNQLLHEKESLLRELKLSTQYKKSSDIAASKDLLKKLKESLTLNMKKLNLFEEDYFQHKNQINEINKTLDEYTAIIQKLIDQKKQCFNQINRITREMAGGKQDSKNNININIIDSTSNLSSAGKIRAFQKKAKEIQSEIDILKSKRSQTQLKLEELTPLFEILERDHQSLLEIINTDNKRIEELQTELKNRIKNDKITEIKDIDIIDVKSLRSSKEIKNDIDNTDTELNKIILPEHSFNLQNPYDLSLIIKKLTELYEKLHSDSEFVINANQNEIFKCFKQFDKLENSLFSIESRINMFLQEINIVSQLRIILSDDQKSFLISLLFIRRDKTSVKFEDLTTPEKVFFIITFYISIKLYINKSIIIFSNASILNQYNKAGSIYRTIRKILPIFERDDSLSKFNLIFVISNLELKKTIKNIKIITIKES